MKLRSNAKKTTSKPTEKSNSNAGRPSGKNDGVALAPGVVVLAHDDQSFWKARIVEIESDVCTLVWEGFDGYEPFRRRVTQLAMMPQEQPYS